MITNTDAIEAAREMLLDNFGNAATDLREAIMAALEDWAYAHGKIAPVREDGDTADLDESYLSISRAIPAFLRAYADGLDNA